MDTWKKKKWAVVDLYLQIKKYKDMKSVFLKYAMLLPIIIFMIWVGLTLFGSIACIFDVSEVYSCNAYCVISRAIVGVVLFAYIVFFGRAIFLEKRNPSGQDEE